MTKIPGSKKWTVVGTAVVILLFIGLIIYGAQYFIKIDNTSSQSMFLSGEYSVDGGEWKQINSDKPINETFHKIVFRGKMDEASTMIYANMTLSSQNIWYTMKTAQGEPIFELILSIKRVYEPILLG